MIDALEVRKIREGFRDQEEESKDSLREDRERRARRRL